MSAGPAARPRGGGSAAKRVEDMSLDELLEFGVAAVEREAEERDAGGGSDGGGTKERRPSGAAPSPAARRGAEADGELDETHQPRGDEKSAKKRRRDAGEEAVAATGSAVDDGDGDDGGGGGAFSVFAKPRKSKAARAAAAERAAEAARAAAEAQAAAAAARAVGELPPVITDEPLVPLNPDAPFKSLGLNEWLVGNCTALGLRKPTPVQHACIPAVLAGRDCIGIAHTGSGKTAAFALPLLQRLCADPYGVFCVVMTPTRELALQIGEQFSALSAGFALRRAVCVGGEEQCRQAAALARRPHVVVATPGRLRDHLDSHGGVRDALRRVSCLVLDEADRLLEPSFEPELAALLSALPSSRQTLLFSATLTPAVAALQRLTGGAAFRFAAYDDLSLPASMRQELLLVPAKVKEVYLAHLLAPERMAAARVRSALVFCATVRGAQLLYETLRELGGAPAVLHSAMAQKARAASLQRFRSGGATLLIATDVASRGLDIPTVDLVINFDVSAAAADYVHRCGRTARAGRGGRALTFVTQYDVGRVAGIEAHTAQKLTPIELPEQEVLRGMTAVLAARRAATMTLAAPGGFDERLAERRKARAAGTARRAAAAGEA